MIDDEEGSVTSPAGRSRRPLQLGAFVYPSYPYRPLPDGVVEDGTRHDVVVVGAGMVGLTVAVDLARKGVRCVLIDDNDTVSAGSRSIAQARRTMEIWSRLGCAEPMRQKGISWSRGHTYHGKDTVLSFTVFPEGGSRFPSFTSLAQYYVEHFLVQRAENFANLEIRWRNRLTSIEAFANGARLTVETPDRTYRMHADWVVAADGAKSSVRTALDLPFRGDRLQDKFVIADVRCQANFPIERHYWFDPPFYDGNTVLRVPQSDSIWRIDWQIDPTADADQELTPDVVRERVTRILGGRTDFEVEWVSTYTSEHRLMDDFRHGRVLFAGDAAHQFSPFGGGRGGNSGIQDADNLTWKLAAVIHGRAPERLLDSYNAERRPIAARNLADSSKSTEFITPKSTHSLAFHDAMLNLAKVVPFAKSYVNTGRFAVWPVLETSPLSFPDTDGFPLSGRPGTPVLDCPLTAADGASAWLTDQVGDDFAVVIYGAPSADVATATERLSVRFPVRLVLIDATDTVVADGVLKDSDSALARLYGVTPGTTYLFRPDQHVLARWRKFDVGAVASAMRRGLAIDQEPLS